MMKNPVRFKFIQAILMVCLVMQVVCGEQEMKCIEREREALLQFKAALVDNYGMLSSWTTADCCQWEGIRCSNLTGHILMLDLPGDFENFPQRYISGEIHKSLMELQQLNYLNLSSNFFNYIQIPEFLGSMSNLRYLDLSSCSFGGKIPSQFGSLSHLKYLNLAHNYYLKGSIPPQLGNLSNLQHLDLSANHFEGNIPSQLEKLSQLLYLDLRHNSFKGNIPSQLEKLSHLQHVDLSYNSFEGNILSQLGNLSWLQHVDLSHNSFEGSMPSQLGNLSNLQHLDLSDNSFEGSIPSQLGNLFELWHLDLSHNSFEGNIPSQLGNLSKLELLSFKSNSLEGGVPKSFGSMCTLESLDLSYNNLSEELIVIINHLSGCSRFSLLELNLGWNKINGILPNFSTFPSLKRLYLDSNKLNGTISEDVRFPAELEELCLSSNSLKGVIIDSYFVNMSKLYSLELSDNSLTLAFTQNWVPPFQLHNIRLRSCNLGPSFPKWLQTQNFFSYIDISNAEILDIVPNWFWPKLGVQEWVVMNISYNNLRGTIPNFPAKQSPYFSLYLASNQFEGPVPPFLRGSVFLNLSKNKFSDFLSFLCSSTVEDLYQLDLSNNQLSGEIPDCWSHFPLLANLDLSHNNFSGKIPTSMGSLLSLQALLLRNNSLTDEIPFSLRNCTKLEMIDMAENRLSGVVPAWIGSKLQVLQYLSLGRNQLNGSLPLQICYLKYIQLLDLSLNNLSGQIPKCINNFTSMAQKNSSRDYRRHWYFVMNKNFSANQSYDLDAFFMWKGSKQMFTNIGLVLLKGIDLSSNHFSEEIPIEMESLFELVTLNLSRNNLSGKIPSNIGKLTSLEFLDLSRNQLVGSIPSSLTQIDRLSMLDLSHNHLSGEIPTDTQLQSFNASSYEDNLDLCGPPLKKLCIHGEPAQEPIVKLHEDEFLFTREFYMSMAIGFVISFWGVFGSILIKRSWRHAYFKFLSNLSDTIYVMAAVKVFKWQHRG